MDKDEFLGRGWVFPPSFTIDKGVKTVAYEEDIQESLYILFSTSPGERVHRYDYGCPLRKYTFEMINTSMLARMQEDIIKAVILFEPRILLNNVSFEKDAKNGILLIKLEYTISQTNKRSNMVYPFYLNEGTDISR